MAAVAQIRGTNRMRNLNVVNNHPTGLTSQDVRDLLASDSVDLMVGCRRSFLFAVRLYSCYPKRPILYESSALDAIRAWSHRRLLRSVNLLPIREIPAKQGQCRLRLMHILGDQGPKRERIDFTKNRLDSAASCHTGCDRGRPVPATDSAAAGIP